MPAHASRLLTIDVLAQVTLIADYLLGGVDWSFAERLREGYKY